LFANGWAAFFVTNSLVQDQPDESTLSMGNGPDGLVMSQARDRAAINNLEDPSFDLYGGVRGLIEETPHVAVALPRSVAIVHACALFVAGTGAHPRGEMLPRGEGRSRGTDFGNNLAR
jgi:hypothetical protein